jgi:dTDP-4-amino-4,6-dideoxygalactose transaminase
VLCDLEEEKTTLNYHELTQTISNRTLAIISVHLFGIPEDSRKINELASSHNAFHIEDAAQSFGSAAGKDSQSMLGTTGDIGIYSFGRGKPFTLMHGGALTTNSDTIAHLVSKKINELPSSTHITTLLIAFKTLLYSLLSHPNLYWIPQHLPFLKLGHTVFNFNFKPARINAFTSALGTIMFETIDHLRMRRTTGEELVTRHLSHCKNYFLTNGQNHAPLLRFPLLLRTREQKRVVLSALQRKGLGVSGMYPTTLNLFKDTKKYFTGARLYPNAQSFSERIITLPLHDYVTENDIKRITCTVADASTQSFYN